MTDWNAIRAEYIGGGISQRKLAEKHGVPVGTLLDRASREGWAQERKNVYNKSITTSIQNIAEAAADNATIAQDIKRKLLMRLARTADKFPTDATEVKTREGKMYVTYKLKDLTAAYKELTADDAQPEKVDEPLMELLQRWDDASKL